VSASLARAGGLGLLLLVAAPRAYADRVDADAARVDWAAGQVVAGGTGIADRHAPSPAVALGTSRRGAEDAARHKLAAKLGALPLAGGGSLADKLTDPAIKARVDLAVAAAIAIAAEPETDGSWHVTLAVPLEALRQAIAGPRALPAAGDSGPPVIVVDGVTAHPALGWTIDGASVPVLWVKAAPAWASNAPHIKAGASGAAGATGVGASGAGATGATLYVLVTGH
jgi:hypothetical protein